MNHHLTGAVVTAVFVFAMLSTHVRAETGHILKDSTGAVIRLAPTPETRREEVWRNHEFKSRAEEGLCLRKPDEFGPCPKKHGRRK